MRVVRQSPQAAGALAWAVCALLKAAAVATVVVAAAAAHDDLVTPPQPAPKEAPIEVTPDKVDDATLEEAPAEKQEQEAPDGPVPDIGGTTVQQVECA